MRLRYTRPALADLDAILSYVVAHSPQAASRIRARIQTVTNLLLSHPRVGAQTDDPAIRRINAFPYPYLVFYEIAGDDVVIHAVRHGARDPSDMLGSR
ncbi:MAG: type II toxin-antitoxin system RelE/ParE family toxin [Pseudolabrys sp.]